MHFYLSSYKIGNQDSVKQLKKIIPANKKTAYISNALDFATDLGRKQANEQDDLNQLKSVGLQAEHFDLKKYFDNPEKLKPDLSKYGVIWVSGGNTFVLRQAMKLSGLDQILIDFNKNNADILYGGYSAGICILSPSLKGLELVDDPNIFPYPQLKQTIWEGLNIIDYAIAPHYQSDHPESHLVEKEVEYYQKNHIPLKTLKDGEVIIV